MASIFASQAGVAELLPILGILGGSMLLAAAHKGPKTPDKNQTEEDRHDKELREDIATYGVSNNAYVALHNKFDLMGAPMIPEMQIDNRDQRWRSNADIDPIEQFVVPIHIALQRQDRDRGHYVMSRTDGNVQPAKRIIITSSLSDEISNPAHPERVSHLADWKHMPDRPNHIQTQKAIALAQRDKNQRKDQFLQHHPETEFFNRAAGQSFRYVGY